VSEGARIETRRVGWFPFEESVKLITHDSNRILLIEAERMRANPGGMAGSATP
jgi:hypothetical protein